MIYKIEVNLARKGSAPIWHYLMEDDYSSCEYASEDEARKVISEEDRGEGNARLIRFTLNGIGTAIP